MAALHDPPGGQADLPDIDDYIVGSCDETPPVIAWPGDDAAPDNPNQLLTLTIEHLDPGVCVIVVNGELDMPNVPLLDQCLRDQLAASPRHLVIDLRPVRFLGATGLTCLLRARQLVQQTPGTQLHLSGLINRVVRRVLGISGLRGLFNTHLTRAHTRAVLVPTMGSPTVDPPAAACHANLPNDSPVPADGNPTTPAVLAAVWCSSAGLTGHLSCAKSPPMTNLERLWTRSALRYQFPNPHRTHRSRNWLLPEGCGFSASRPQARVPTIDTTLATSPSIPSYKTPSQWS